MARPSFPATLAILVVVGGLVLGVFFFALNDDASGRSLDEVVAQDAAVSSLAVVTIALNGYDASRLVHSLRGRGRFRGDIFVIGDDCSPRPPVSRDARPARSFSIERRRCVSGDSALFVATANNGRMLDGEGDCIVRRLGRPPRAGPRRGRVGE